VQDCQKVEGFLRRSTRAGCCSKDLLNFSDICLEAVQKLFRAVLHNPEHLLHQLLPQFLPLPTVIPLENAPTTDNFLIACLI